MAEVKKKKTTKKPKKTESLKPKSKGGKGSGRGGAREGAGRPKGKLEASTILKIKAQAKVREIIAENAPKLIETQMKLAYGYPVLMEIIERRGKKGQALKPLTIEVHDPIVIKAFTKDPKKYKGKYFVMKAKPDARALENLLDRGLDKPKSSVEIDLEATVEDNRKLDAKSQEELIDELRQAVTGSKKSD